MTEATEKAVEKDALIPRWALIAGGVMLIVGIGIGTTRGSRTRSNAVYMLNNADVRLVALEGNKPITDGYDSRYGLVVLDSNQRDYEALLGFCTSKPDMALDVFREVLNADKWQGKALACHMAFYLAQESRLTLEDLTRMVKLLEDPNEDLRRVAQSELGMLLVVRNLDKETYGVIGSAPANLKSPFSAGTADVELPDPVRKGDWLRMKWSCPEACAAWFKTFGAQVKWDDNLKRFALSK